MKTSRRPVVALDKDDCLLTYSPTFDVWHQTMYGQEVNLRDLAFKKIPFTNRDAFVEFAKTDEFKRLPSEPGAEQAVRDLSEVYDVVVLTATAPQFYDSVRASLMERFPAISKIELTMDKGSSVTQLGAVALVDDLPRYLTQISSPAVPVCYAQYYNEDYKGLRGRWPQIVRYLVALADVIDF